MQGGALRMAPVARVSPRSRTLLMGSYGAISGAKSAMATTIPSSTRPTCAERCEMMLRTVSRHRLAGRALSSSSACSTVGVLVAMA